MSTMYSTRLGSITPEQFQKALQRLGLGDFVNAEPIPYGLFGQNVYLTSSTGEYVFRGAPHSSWQFPTERFFTDLLHQHTYTPVPYPYLFDPSIDIFGWGYIVMPRLPGIVLQNKEIKAQLSVEDRLEIARAVARALIEVQKMNWDCSGSYQAETNRILPYEIHYRERVVQHIHEKLEASCSYNANTTLHDIEFVEGIVNRLGSVLHHSFQPTVVLGDYGEHNLVVEKNNNHWKVSGVFDLMTAHFGDGAADLSGPVMGYLKEDINLADAFVQEFLSYRPAVNGLVDLQQLYMLDLALSIWRHFQKHEGGLPEDTTKKMTFRQWVKPFIDYWKKYS